MLILLVFLYHLFELLLLTLEHMVTVHFSWEGSFLDILDILFDGAGDHLCYVCVLLDKLRCESLEVAD